MNYKLPPPPPLILKGQWNAKKYFTTLCARNKLARKHGFIFATFSGLQGLSDLLTKSMQSPAVISVDETSDGLTTIQPTPSRTLTKTLCLSMRHAAGNPEARDQCFRILHELARQILTVLIRESERLLLQSIQLDRDLHIQELDRYFAPGSAALIIELAVHLPLDLRHRPDEWLES